MCGLNFVLVVLCCTCCAVVADSVLWSVGAAIDVTALLPVDAFTNITTIPTAVYRLTLDVSTASVVPPPLNLETDPFYAGRPPTLQFCDVSSGVTLGSTVVVVPSSALVSSLIEVGESFPLEIIELLFGRRPTHGTLLESIILSPNDGGSTVIALCGATGIALKPTNPSLIPRQCSMPPPMLRVRIITTALTVSAAALLSQPIVPTNVSSDRVTVVDLRGGAPVAAEIEQTSAWCRLDRVPIVARVGRPSASLPIVLTDAWGNVATTAQDLALPIAVEAATLLAVQQSSRAEVFVPAGSWCGSSGSLLISGRATATQAHRNVTGRASLPLALRLLLGSQTSSVVLSGSSASCARVQLAPGGPYRLVFAVAPRFQPATNEHFAVSQSFTVPSNVALEVAISIHDVAGNPVTISVPSCDGRWAPVSRAVDAPLPSQVCLQCYINGSSTSFGFAPPIGTEVVRLLISEVSMQPEVMLSVKCNVHDAVSPRRNISSEAAIAVVPHGEFDCVGPDTNITAVLTQNSLDDMQGVFFSHSISEVPLAQATFIIPSSAEYRDAEEEFPDLLEWVLVPKSGFIAIPLGLLSALAFGAHYTTVSHLNLNLTKPLCRSLTREMFQSSLATWLHGVGQNSTRFYSHLDMATVPSVETKEALSVCHGDNIEALEFVQLTCCQQNGKCLSSTTETPLAYALLIGGILMGVVVSLATFLYLRSSLQATPVHLLNRHTMDMSSKSRVAFAHLLAPFVLIAHLYFIFRLTNTAASFLFYMDVVLPSLWLIAVFTRFLFPLYVLTAPFYWTTGVLILCYSQFLLTNAVIWTASSLHLNIRLIPFLCATVLIVLQVFFTIRDASNELRPSILSPGVAAHSMVPVDAVMSLELFTCTVMMFMFAVTWVEDITPFAAVVAAFVVLAYASLWNYSLAAQVEAGFKKHFGEGSNSALVRLLQRSAAGRSGSQHVDEGFDTDDTESNASVVDADHPKSSGRRNGGRRASAGGAAGTDSESEHLITREVTNTLTHLVSSHSGAAASAANEDFNDDPADVDYAHVAEEDDYDENGNRLARKQPRGTEMLPIAPLARNGQSRSSHFGGSNVSSPASPSALDELFRSASMLNLKQISRAGRRPGALSPALGQSPVEQSAASRRPSAAPTATSATLEPQQQHHQLQASKMKENPSIAPPRRHPSTAAAVNSAETARLIENLDRAMLI